MKKCRTSFRSKVLIVLASLLLMATLSSPVGAILAPDSTPSLEYAYAFHDLQASGDTGFFVKYYVPYGTLPSETITQAYIGRILYNGSPVGATQPVAYMTKGYGYGGFWLYFSPGVITWGSSNYTANIQGNLALSWNGTYPNSPNLNIEWSPPGTLGACVLAMAADLESLWPLNLREEATNKLTTTYGEGYFTQMIPGLRTIAPTVFSVQVSKPAFVRNVHAGTYGTSLENRLTGSGFDTAITDLGNFLNFPKTLMTAFIMLIFGFVTALSLMYFATHTGRTVLPVVFLIMLAGLFTGLTPWTLIAAWIGIETLGTIYIQFIKGG